MRGIGIVLAGVAVVLVAGCGSSDSGNTVLDTSSTTSTQVEATDTGPGAEDDTAQNAPTTSSSTSSTMAPESTTTAPQSGQGAELTDSARVSTIGLGPVYVGDTIELVAEKIGVELEAIPDVAGDETCRYHTAPGGPPGVSFVVTYGRVSRVDIESPSIITTRSGAGIGSTREDIIGLFGDKIVVSSNGATGGEDLTYVPVDDKDANLRIVFETNAEGVVVRFRTGQLPEVDYDGC
ncbi:MAG: hypothetical protein GY708_21505 [Actinomycetia bacterium]|nr:hypothetical protein [Actinomycetes bacterium]